MSLVLYVAKIVWSANCRLAVTFCGVPSGPNSTHCTAELELIFTYSIPEFGSIQMSSTLADVGAELVLYTVALVLDEAYAECAYVLTELAKSNAAWPVTLAVLALLNPA